MKKRRIKRKKMVKNKKKNQRKTREKEKKEKECNYEFHITKGEIFKVKICIKSSEWNVETQL